MDCTYDKKSGRRNEAVYTNDNAFFGNAKEITNGSKIKIPVSPKAQVIILPLLRHLKC